MTIEKGFAETIKDLRKEKGYSLAKLEELTGVSASYINRIENRERENPTVEKIYKLSLGLDVPARKLLNICLMEYEKES